MPKANNNIKRILSAKFRFLIFIRRYLIAFKDSLTPRKYSYSEYGEDKLIAKCLENYNLNNGIYIEIGANQPTKISNTYLFYRKGLKGILVEPDESLALLLKNFRKRDIIIQACCGASLGLAKFNFSLVSVNNSVIELKENNSLKSEYIPKITIDEITRVITPEWIYFLSIDTEGYDYEVLKGAKKTLEKTYLVSVEYQGKETKSQILTFMDNNSFRILQNNGLNMIFENRNTFEEYKKKKNV